MKDFVVGLFAVLTMLAILPTAALAAPAPAELEKARAAFLEGRELMGQGAWTQAREHFLVAASAKDTPGLRYYIAYCLEKEDLLVESLAAYREATRLLEAQPAQDVERLIPVAMQRVKDQLPHVVLHGLKPEAKISLDGGSREQRDSMFVNPGKHTLEVTAPGYAPFREEFVAQRGETTLINVDLVPPPPPGETRPATRADSDHRLSPARRAIFWTSAGLGIVGLGTGLVGTGLYIKSSADVSDAAERVDELAPSGSAPCGSAPKDALAEACEDLRKASNQKISARVIFIAGYATFGAGVVGALAAQFLGKKKGVRVSASPVEGGGWLGISGTF